jgi:hypothetical protein
VLAYNMKRMINLFGVKPLMQAIAAWPRAPAGASHRSRATPASEIIFSHDLGRFAQFAEPAGNTRSVRKGDDRDSFSYGRHSLTQRAWSTAGELLSWPGVL